MSRRRCCCAVSPATCATICSSTCNEFSLVPSGLTVGTTPASWWDAHAGWLPPLNGNLTTIVGNLNGVTFLPGTCALHSHPDFDPPCTFNLGICSDIYTDTSTATVCDENCVYGPAWAFEVSVLLLGPGDTAYVFSPFSRQASSSCAPLSEVLFTVPAGTWVVLVYLEFHYYFDSSNWSSESIAFRRDFSAIIDCADLNNLEVDFYAQTEVKWDYPSYSCLSEAISIDGSSAKITLSCVSGIDFDCTDFNCTNFG